MMYFRMEGGNGAENDVKVRCGRHVDKCVLQVQYLKYLYYYYASYWRTYLEVFVSQGQRQLLLTGQMPVRLTTLRRMNLQYRTLCHVAVTYNHYTHLTPHLQYIPNCSTSPSRPAVMGWSPAISSALAAELPADPEAALAALSSLLLEVCEGLDIPTLALNDWRAEAEVGFISADSEPSVVDEEVAEGRVDELAPLPACRLLHDRFIYVYLWSKTAA